MKSKKLKEPPIQSKSLRTVQKLNRLAAVFSEIVAVCSVIALCYSLIGAIVIAIAPDGSELSRHIVFQTGMNKATKVATLLSQSIVLLGGAFLARMANRTFKRELAAGTPFTEECANDMKKLGWRVILINLAALIAAAILYQALSDLTGAVGDYTAEGSVDLALGISMLILSAIYRYGAEVNGALHAVDVLEEARKI